MNEIYVIWGCGARGQFLYEVLKSFFTIAFFIDQRKAQPGSTYDRIPILSFGEYLQSGATLPIIVTPRSNEDILMLLEQSNIKNYIVMDDILGLSNTALRFEDSNVKRISSREVGHKLSCAVVSILQQIIKNYCTHYVFSQRQDYTSNMRSIYDFLHAKHPAIDRVNDAVVPFYKIVTTENLYPVRFGNLPSNTDLLILHGIPTDFAEASLLQQAELRNIPVVLAEDGLIRSIVPGGYTKTSAKFNLSHSGIFDAHGIYINANAPSELENTLNSSLELPPDQLKRAKSLIDKIVKRHISKYNFQIDRQLCIGSKSRKKVLVIDQVYGDKSIEFGQANRHTFSAMLNAAIEENPDADILIKTHPASNTTRGYFTSLEAKAPIHKITFDINPICLLEQIDKVYVCTSQMGFEALMCGKEVHVFGMPFYAGWGVTHDRLHCPRRTKKRTVEEIFFAAYVKHSIYVSYKTNSVCEIEQAIDELLELREEYWAEQAKK